jgi:hypothetical protein
MKIINYGQTVFVALLLFSLMLSGPPVSVNAAATQSPLDQYRARWNAIDQNNADKLLELASWAWDTHSKSLQVMKRAQADLEAALKIKKAKNEDALAVNLKLAQVTAQIKKLTGGATTDPNTTRIIEKGDLLNMADIYMIRLRELTPNDNVAVVFKNDVINRYVKLMQGREVDDWNKPWKEKAFKNMPATRRVLEIRKHQETNIELLKDIQIETDPMFFRVFQRMIWPQIRNRCAMPLCHGGKEKPRKGPKFVVDTKLDSLNGRYTNFALLSGYQAGQGRRIINRQEPQMSLLLQYGLDRRVSTLRHKKEIKPPLFKSMDDPLFKRMCAWIKALKGPLHPDYNIEKKLNGVEVELRGKRKIIIRGLE